jgi:3-oxoacyl-[acyl-carrier protein] reductase
MNKKYALVTGASGGIGKAIAIQLIQQGYGVYLHYHKNKESVKKLTNQYQQDEIHLVGADLSKPDGVTTLMNQVHHQIDDLILNSGNSYYGLITDMNETLVNEMVQLHSTSPFLLTKSLAPSMIKKKKGNIILITSVWGQVGASCEVLYSMLKGGQNTLVKGLAKELAPSNIRVNGVAPGAINTNMLGHLVQDERMELEMEIPMGRLGEPKEVADVVSFLLSEKASYINGHIISVNGAWHTT